MPPMVITMIPFVGEYYDVYNNTLVVRATIRIVGMELCHWEDIPDRLWRGETNLSADEFRRDHLTFLGTLDRVSSSQRITSNIRSNS
jgi:uncharacterized protein YhfF